MRAWTFHAKTFAAPKGFLVVIRSVRALLRACLVLPTILTAALAFDQAEFQSVIDQCAACHGVDGIAKDVEVPDLAGQHDAYLFKQLQHFKSGRRPHKEMRYMSRHLTDEEMLAISQYYSRMAR